MLPRSKHPNRERVIREFQKGKPLTAYEIEDCCYLSLRSARLYLKLLHREEKAIHISYWRREAKYGPFTPHYLWGPGEDAVKPRPVTSAERQRLRRRDPQVAEEESKKKRIARAKADPVPPSCSLIDLLGVKR